MSTFNLTDDTIKLGEVNLDKTQFSLPKRTIILSARASYIHDMVNGESVPTDKLAKITCHMQDADKVKVLTGMGLSAEDLKSITVEIHDNLDKIGKLAEDDGLIGLTVELIDPQVRLLWNMSRRGWSGVKIVVSDIKIIQLVDNDDK